MSVVTPNKLKLNVFMPSDLDDPRKKVLQHLAELFSLKAAEVSDKLEVQVNQIKSSKLLGAVKTQKKTANDARGASLVFLPENTKRSKRSGSQKKSIRA